MKKTKLLIMLLAFVAFGTTAWAQQSGEHELLFTDYYGAYYRFYYTSTDAAGETVTLSSLLAFQKPNEMTSNDVNNSVLINSHYTITADAQCPSNIQSGYDMDFPDHILFMLLFSGNSSNYNDLVSKSVVIMPDYEGYGVSANRTHLYLAEELTAKQVVDGAVSGLQLYQQLVTAGNAPRLANDWRSFSMGFSQGGAVALAVQRYIEQHGLSSDLRFRGTLCGDGPYDLIATLRYYMEDNGTSYDVTTDHRAEQATLPVVLPMMLKGMIDSEPVMANYQLSDYLTDDFLATGILDWLNSKTVTNKQIATAWLDQLQNGSTTVNDIAYSAPATMSQMFSKHGDAPWADLSKVFTPGFYSYLTDLSNFNSVPTHPNNAYQAMHLALANNGLCTGWRPSHRIQFMHSKKDMVVPYGNYLAFRDAHPEDEDVIYRVDNTFSTADHQEAGTAFLSSLGNMGEKLHWIDESSLEWIGSGTEDDPYQIWNGDEWQLLCTRVNGEVSYYTGKYFKLMADINIEETFSTRPTKQVGHGENVNFRGIFDGNGHTMTINYVDNNDEDYCAPFRYIRNATIKNLHVTGSITKTDNRNAGGLVGTAFGTCHITNCRSSVDIFFDDPGDCSSGGFIGEVGTSSSTDDVYFDNCLFDGKLRGTSAYSWGGFIGWVEDEPDAYFNNCLFAPAQVNIGTDGSKTFARGDDLHFTNNYYKTLINDAQGSTDASSMDNESLRTALGNGWEIVTEDGVDKVVPIMGPRALNGEGTPASPYLIANVSDWHALATNVYLGETYSGKYFQMTADISVGRMVGPSEANSFQGIFDGNGHTLTFSYTTSEDFCAPFRYANGATFQNLEITGTINTGSQYAAGFVGYVTGNGCTFTNCKSDITINASRNGEGAHGGFAAYLKNGSSVFNGCAFTGSMVTTNGTTSCGGFVGWTEGLENSSTTVGTASVTFTDCFYSPTSNTIDTYRSATFARGRDYYQNTNNSGTPSNIKTQNNCYYTQTFGLVQGKQPHSITGSSTYDVTVAFHGEGTEYSVSGITAYSKGVVFDGNLYASKSDQVTLDLSCTPPEGYGCSGYFASAGTLSKNNTECYNLSMPDEDVTINANCAVILTTYYVDEHGTMHDNVTAFSLNSSMTTLEGGTYVVNENVTFDESITCRDDIVLILADGCTMNIETDGPTYTGLGGMYSIGNDIYYHSITVYGQTEQTGVLNTSVIVARATINGGTLSITGIMGDVITVNNGVVNGYLMAVTLLNSSPTTVRLITINGGQVTTPDDGYGINVRDGDIILGWTNLTDFIQANVYEIEGTGSVSVKPGQTLTDGTHFYTGTLTDEEIAAIAGQTLRPAVVTLDIAGYGTGGGGWNLIASPVGTVAIEDVTHLRDNNFDLYRFNQAANLEWENYKSTDGNNQPLHPDFTTLECGKGYLYANSEDVTLIFTGEPYSGNGEVTLSKTTGVGFEGWNLVGNPFNETAYIADGRSFYTMNAEGSELMAATSNSIEAMEGIFVIANQDEETMTFTTTEPQNGNSKGLVLNLCRGRGVIDRAIVRFGEGGMLPKFQLSDNSTKVYIPQDGMDYAVVNVGRDVARYVSTGVNEMPVNFKASENGTYTLSLSSEEVSFNYLHLIDNMTGYDVDLLATPSYTFSAKTSDYASRFRLVFVCGDANDDNAFAFISDGNIIVNGEGMLQVVDMMGRVIVCTDVARNVSTQGMTPGVYVLRLVNGNDVKTQKMVIQ